MSDAKENDDADEASAPLLQNPAAGPVITVAAVDNHPVVLSGVDDWLTTMGEGIRVIATAATVEDLLAGPGQTADVVLLDLYLRDGTDVERNVKLIREAGPAVLILSVFSDPTSVRRAMRAGADGYLLKSEDSDVAREAVRAVADGQGWVSSRLAYILSTDPSVDRPSLSAQEKRALELYAAGLPMKSVARRMAITQDTAKQYIARVREKYNRAGRSAGTKVELYRRAVEDGHIPPSDNTGPPRM